MTTRTAAASPGRWREWNGTKSTAWIPPPREGAIARIALKKRVKPLYAIGGEYKLFALLAKLLPCGAVSRILGRMYAGK